MKLNKNFKMDKTLDFLQKLADTWIWKIPFSQETNTYLTIGPEGKDFEVLTNLELGLFGTGASSGGSDHNDNSEGKGAVRIQPKDCASGGKLKLNGSNKYICRETRKPEKIHPFIKECPHCKLTDFFYHTDARWGIDTKSHFRYEIPRYNGWVFEPKTQSSENREFSLSLYLIDSNNEHFKNILKVQLDNGKKPNKNFLPYSADFYASNPKMVAKFKIILGDENAIVERVSVENIIYDEKIIKILSDYLTESSNLTKKSYNYEEIKSHINIFQKRTAHGKERGETFRRS